MMKIVVLMLVLGMASVASAALVTGNVTWTVEGWTGEGGQLIGTGTALGDVDLNLALSTFGTVADIIVPDPTPLQTAPFQTVSWRSLVTRAK